MKSNKRVVRNPPLSLSVSFIYIISITEWNAGRSVYRVVALISPPHLPETRNAFVDSRGCINSRIHSSITLTISLWASPSHLRYTYHFNAEFVHVSTFLHSLVSVKWLHMPGVEPFWGNKLVRVCVTDQTHITNDQIPLHQFDLNRRGKCSVQNSKYFDAFPF